jgi:A/G-specific adenine glycosylase
MSSPISPPLRDVRRAVRRWASTVDRPLPWRGERDPYRVLVSEVMLQQTQAGRVIEPYLRFLKRFPSVGALASAEQADVLREWGTLGYNRRAQNLWRAARAIIERGGFPRTVEELQELPGLGPYTSRAVASFAFDADCGVVDANVRRVISRALGDGDVQEKADALAPRGSSAAWNQTMIDLGALVCTARKPACGQCPLRRWCTWTASPSPARRSERPFKETSRYVRGRIVAELRCGPRTVAALREHAGVEQARFDAALASLERDGLVHRADGGRRIRL